MEAVPPSHSETRVPTAAGTFRLRIYHDPCDAGPIAVIGGESFSSEPVLVCLHSNCFISENLGSLDCGCRRRLDSALQIIAAQGGVLVYLRRETSVRKCALQVPGHPALSRKNFAAAALVLKDLGLETIRLITDNPGDAVALEEYDVCVTGQVPIGAAYSNPSSFASAFRQSLRTNAESLPVEILEIEMPPAFRPLIHVNFATDGCHQTRGVAASISCEADWRRVHALREQYDAVAVGAHTWNLDCPRLTVRCERLGREPRRQPARIIFAGAHECSIRGHGGRIFLIGAPPAAECCGATLIPSYDHNLLPPLESLYHFGIRSIFVEGGPTILHSFLSQDLADVITVFVRVDEEEAAHRIARMALPCLPPSLQTQRFGAGFLLSCVRKPAGWIPTRTTAAMAAKSEP